MNIRQADAADQQSPPLASRLVCMLVTDRPGVSRSTDCGTAYACVTPAGRRSRHAPTQQAGLAAAAAQGLRRRTWPGLAAAAAAGTAAARPAPAAARSTRALHMINSSSGDAQQKVPHHKKQMMCRRSGELACISNSVLCCGRHRAACSSVATTCDELTAGQLLQGGAQPTPPCTHLALGLSKLLLRQRGPPHHPCCALPAPLQARHQLHHHSHYRRWSGRAAVAAGCKVELSAAAPALGCCSCCCCVARCCTWPAAASGTPGQRLPAQPAGAHQMLTARHSGPVHTYREAKQAMNMVLRSVVLIIHAAPCRSNSS